ELAAAVHQGRQLDVAGLGHGTRVERADLAVVLIGGADEPCRVRDLRDVHAGRVHAVALQPGAIVREVVPHRTDQYRPGAEHTEAVGDVAADAAASDHQVVGQERQ